LVSTQLCPIELTGSLPTCLSVRLNDSQLESTMISLWLNWSASGTSTVTAQASPASALPESHSTAARAALRIRLIRVVLSTVSVSPRFGGSMLANSAPVHGPHGEL